MLRLNEMDDCAYFRGGPPACEISTSGADTSHSPSTKANLLSASAHDYQAKLSTGANAACCIPGSFDKKSEARLGCGDEPRGFG
jgi:hypothetical protein